jgi:hypothetical protein
VAVLERMAWLLNGTPKQNFTKHGKAKNIEAVGTSKIKTIL